MLVSSFFGIASYSAPCSYSILSIYSSLSIKFLLFWDKWVLDSHWEGHASRHVANCYSLNFWFSDTSCSLTHSDFLQAGGPLSHMPLYNLFSY